MLDRDSILTLEDNNEYCIVNQIDNEGITYIFLVDINDNNNKIIARLDGDIVSEITDKDEIDKVVYLLANGNN